jgi:hypothetical protein
LTELVVSGASLPTSAEAGLKEAEDVFSFLKICTRVWSKVEKTKERGRGDFKSRVYECFVVGSLKFESEHKRKREKDFSPLPLFAFHILHIINCGFGR